MGVRVEQKTHTHTHTLAGRKRRREGYYTPAGARESRYDEEVVLQGPPRVSCEVMAQCTPVNAGVTLITNCSDIEGELKLT